jgi:hypothetical protein
MCSEDIRHALLEFMMKTNGGRVKLPQPERIFVVVQKQSRLMRNAFERNGFDAQA